MKYLYEIHCHTKESSKCSRIGAKELVSFYKSINFDGVCITDHFIGGNTTVPSDIPWDEQVRMFFKSYEFAKEEGDKIGLQVFRGLEYSYGGTDFLVYGISPEWLISHPEVMNLRLPHRLDLMRENGGFIIQAHPFREAHYIDMIRLLPRNVDGIEVMNAERTDFENSMANMYAENYNLPKFCGSDNHFGARERLCATVLETKAYSIEDIISCVLQGNSERIYIKSDNI